MVNIPVSDEETRPHILGEATKVVVFKDEFSEDGSVQSLPAEEFVAKYEPMLFQYCYYNGANSNFPLTASIFYYLDDVEFELYHSNRPDYQKIGFTGKKQSEINKLLNEAKKAKFEYSCMEKNNE